MTETQNSGQGAMERKKPLILLVDGDTSKLFFNSIVLQRLDYHLFPTKTAEDALAIMDLAKPVLVITEIALPHMNGFELLKSIKAGPVTRAIPIVVYTAVRDPKIRTACEQAGCTAYLNHSADPNALYAAVQKATETMPRQFVRLATSLDVIIGAEGIPGFSVKKAKITALSENGMYVSMLTPLEFGTVLPFTVMLDEESESSAVSVQGKVLYSSRKSDPGRQTGMGVKFEKIDDAGRERIRHFIKDKLTEGIAVAIT